MIALVVTQLVGFETAGASPRRRANRRIKPSQAIIAGLAGTALILFIFDFALLLAIPDIGQGDEGPETLIPDVLTATLGSGFTKLFFAGADRLRLQHRYRHAGDDRADDLRHGQERPAARMRDS